MEDGALCQEQFLVHGLVYMYMYVASDRLASGIIHVCIMTTVL